jgi:SAM-dependent methyltransferase
MKLSPEIIDLVGAEAGVGDDYFDPGEFAIRARLEDEHYWHLHRREVLLDVVRDACPDPSAPIVELGCGVGTVATHLNRNGFRVDYADVHREALELARQRAAAGGAADTGETPGNDWPRRFLRVDITRRLPAADHRGILLLDVLEHLPDGEDAKVMRAARESLLANGAGTGGFVLFTVPAFQFLWSPWDDLERHKRRYTLASARALAVETGFEVARATYFFFPLFFAAGAVKGLRSVRNLLRTKRRPPRFEELTETKSHPALNRGLLSLLSLERRWLRGRDLPLGTSILILARPSSVA